MNISERRARTKRKIDQKVTLANRLGYGKYRSPSDRIKELPNALQGL